MHVNMTCSALLVLIASSIRCNHLQDVEHIGDTCPLCAGEASAPRPAPRQADFRPAGVQHSRPSFAVRTSQLSGTLTPIGSSC